LEIDKNLSVTLSLTMSRVEKVRHQIRKKTHKFIILKFWVVSGINPLCGFDLCLTDVVFFFGELSQNLLVVSALKICLGN